MVVFPVSTDIHTIAAETCWDQQLLDYEPDIKHVHFLICVDAQTDCRFPYRVLRFSPGNPHHGHIKHAYRMMNYALQNCNNLETLTIQFPYDVDPGHEPPYTPHDQHILYLKLTEWFRYAGQKKTAMNIQNVILVVSPGDRMDIKADQSHPIALGGNEIAEQGVGDLSGLGSLAVSRWMADRFFNFAGEGIVSRVAVRLA